MKRTLSFLALLVVSLFFVVSVTTVSATDNLQYEDSDEYQNFLKEQARNKVTVQVDPSSLSGVKKAHDRVQREEEYIVGLINRYAPDRGATLASWKENLSWLESNYSELKDQENVNMQLVNSYIEAYRCVLQDENLPDEKIAKDLPATASAADNLQYEDSDEYQNFLKEQARNKVTGQVDPSSLSGVTYFGTTGKQMQASIKSSHRTRVLIIMV